MPGFVLDNDATASALLQDLSRSGGVPSRRSLGNAAFRRHRAAGRRLGGGVDAIGGRPQPLPVDTVPDVVDTALADLRFAGRYVPAGPGPDPIAGDFYDLLQLD